MEKRLWKITQEKRRRRPRRTSLKRSMSCASSCDGCAIIVRLARARKMIEMLSSGTYKNKQEIGDMFVMSQAQVSRLCRSAFLSPVIVEKLVDCTLLLPRFTAVADKLITLSL